MGLYTSMERLRDLSSTFQLFYASPVRMSSSVARNHMMHVEAFQRVESLRRPGHNARVKRQ